MKNDADLIYGVQAVMEALTAGRSVSTIYMARGAGGASQSLKAQAKNSGCQGEPQIRRPSISISSSWR